MIIIYANVIFLIEIIIEKHNHEMNSFIHSFICQVETETAALRRKLKKKTDERQEMEEAFTTEV